MNMVTLATFKKLNSKSFIFSNFLYEFLHVCLNFGGKNFPSMLHRPYHMVVNIAHRSAIMYKVILHTHSIPHFMKKSKHRLAF
jgi:hypothetical protein